VTFIHFSAAAALAVALAVAVAAVTASVDVVYMINEGYVDDRYVIDIAPLPAV